MSTADAIVQLVDEVMCRLDALSPATGVRSLDLLQTIETRCAGIVAELAQDTDDHLAAEACLTVASICDTGDPDWWPSALGRLCARSVDRTDAEAVTQPAAARMLGVTRGTVAQLLARGSLDRHPDGGVLRSSVLARLARLSS